MSNEPPAWLQNQVIDGLQRLMALRLPGSPSEDMVVGTARVWLEAISFNRVLERERDSFRLRTAFTLLCRDCRQWPAPADLISRLPLIEVPNYRALPVPEQRRAAQRAAATEVCQGLRETMAYKHWLEQHADRRESPWQRLIREMLRRMRLGRDL